MVSRDVNYGVIEYDELPESDAEREWAPLRDKLETIMASPARHAPKWNLIADYGSKASAKGAVRELRRARGANSRVEGWRFEQKPVELNLDGEDVLREGVFAQFDPASVTDPNLKAENDRAFAQYRQHQQDAKRLRDQEKVRSDAQEMVG